MERFWNLFHVHCVCVNLMDMAWDFLYLYIYFLKKYLFIFFTLLPVCISGSEQAFCEVDWLSEWVMILLYVSWFALILWGHFPIFDESRHVWVIYWMYWYYWDLSTLPRCICVFHLRKLLLTTVVSLAVTEKSALLPVIKLHTHNRQIKHIFRQRHQKIW